MGSMMAPLASVAGAALARVRALPPVRRDGDDEGQGMAAAAFAEAAPGHARARRLGWRRAAGALAVVAVMVASLLLPPSFAVARNGYWKFAETETPSVSNNLDDVDSGQAASTQTAQYIWHWVAVDEDGTETDMYEQAQENAYKTVTSTNVETPTTEAVPADGNDWTNIHSSDYDTSGDSILGSFDAASGGWSKSAPDMLKEPFKALQYMVASLVGGITMGIVRTATWMLTMVDVNKLLDVGGAAGGVWSSFDEKARAIHDSIAVPIGSGILSLMLAVELVKLSDRRRNMGRMAAEQLVRTLVMYAVGLTLVTYAYDLLFVIYDIGSNVTSHVSRSIGDGSLTAVATNLSGTFGSAFGKVTYGAFWSVFLFLIVAVMLVTSCAKLAVTVFSTCFLRMAEIYLRAAFAAIPLSFFTSDDGRRTSVGYLKRFGACCLLAAVLVFCISLSSSMFSVVGSLLEGVQVDAETNVLGIQGVIKAVAPTFLCVTCLDMVVKKANDVATSALGM